MDWNTLLSVALGGLIATIGAILTNRFQAIERDKDRLEARREAKIQLALELQRSDIRIIEDSIDVILKTMNILHLIRLEGEATGQSIDEVNQKVQFLIKDKESWLNNFSESSVLADKLSISLGGNFLAEHNSFGEDWNKFVRLVIYESSASNEEIEKLRVTITLTAGKLHRMLNEKLISLRDT
jgi:hypothetical protein